MIRTLKWFFQNSRAAYWRDVLLGGTIAISPAFVLAADNDKDKDNDRSKRNGQASSARQMGSTNSSRSGGNTGNNAAGHQSSEISGARRNAGSNSSTQISGNAGTAFNAQGGSKKVDGGDKNRPAFRSVDDSGKNFNKASESKRDRDSDNGAKKKFDQADVKTLDRKIDPKTLGGNGQSKNSDELKNRTNSRSDDLGKKMRNPDGPKNLNQIPDLGGNKKTHDNDDKGRGGKTNDLSDKGPKKLVKPDDLQKLNKRPQIVKPSDFDKKSHKDGDGKSDHDNSKHGDGKFAHGNSKHDDGKKPGNFLDQHKKGKFDGIVKGAVAKKLDLGKQFDLKHKGDLTLKLNLQQKIKLHGGWSKSHWAGLVGPGFGAGCSPIVYCGPGYFPSHCLYPGWTPWVEYCWGFRPDPICDPRPWFCRPWVYDPCPVWVRWDYPVWYELPVVACGTFVDVEPVVIDEGLDLQLLAVRFVDPGQPELREGPRYRIWARNNSSRTIVKDFNILLMAANSRESEIGLPQAGVRVDSMEPGEIKAFDIRLPFESTAMARDDQGNAMPFSQLHVLLDSHLEVPEAFEQNNGAVIARGDILPVDPVIFGSDSAIPVPGTEINIAGEGFGPEPGQVLVHVGGIELQAEIEGWYDLGVRVKVPALALAGPTDAELVVIRGDTAASNPLTVQLTLPVAVR